MTPWHETDKRIAVSIARRILNDNEETMRGCPQCGSMFFVPLQPELFGCGGCGYQTNKPALRTVQMAEWVLDLIGTSWRLEGHEWSPEKRQVVRFRDDARERCAEMLLEWNEAWSAWTDRDLIVSDMYGQDVAVLDISVLGIVVADNLSRGVPNILLEPWPRDEDLPQHEDDGS